MRRTPFASLTPDPPNVSCVGFDHLSPSGPSRFPCPRVDTPPQSLSSSLQKTQYENTAILLIIKEGGGRVSLDGVAARGLVNVKDPRRSRGRDEVGTCSDETNPDVSIRRNAYCSGERSSLLLQKIEIL